MATNINEEHLHHMAKYLHRAKRALNEVREKYAGPIARTFGTVETAGGAWLGGAIEGRSGGATVLRVPINLGLGAIFLAAGHLNIGKEHSSHLLNVGNGLLGSYLAATGYAFGKRWRETGKIWSNPWSSPYGEVAAPAVHGDLSEAQMAAIVSRMQQAAASPQG